MWLGQGPWTAQAALLAWETSVERRSGLRVTLLNLFARHGGAETCARNLLEGLRRRGHEARMPIGRADGALPPHVELLPRFFPEFALQRLLSRLGGLTDTAMLLPLWHAWRHPRLVDVDVVHGHI